MGIKLFNTLTRIKEEFVPNTPGHVGMYVCGPTVYSDAHLGHAKTAVAFDIIRRWLEHSGLQVRHVANVTDVGHITESFGDEGRDRIGERAKLEKLEPMEIADKYYWAYFADMSRLNVLRPSITPRASGHIPEQIALTEELIKRGLAYERGGSVYFRVKAWPKYGELSGRNIDELEVGTREDVRIEKEDPRDFALWKFAEPEHIMRWESPWGEGFPGWHIECSAMALKYLGENFDIHGGGLDLQFPHHEAEIAQAEGADHAFARYWLHSNMLTASGEKMSKSKGNFLTLQDFFANNNPMVLRYILVSSHYRSITEITPEIIVAAVASLTRLGDTKRALEAALARTDVEGTDAADPLLLEKLKQHQAEFAAAMNDDFNTPEALAAMFALSKEINSALTRKAGVTALRQALELYTQLGEAVLGLFPENAAQHVSGKSNQVLLEELIAVAIEARQGFRARREFARSDELRDKLKEAGLLLEDTSDGTRWKIE